MPVRGDIVTAQGTTPTWLRLAKGPKESVLTNDGTDIKHSDYTITATFLEVPASSLRYITVVGHNWGYYEVSVSGYVSSGSGTCLAKWIFGGYTGSFGNAVLLARESAGMALGDLKRTGFPNDDTPRTAMAVLNNHATYPAYLWVTVYSYCSNYGDGYQPPTVTLESADIKSPNIVVNQNTNYSDIYTTGGIHVGGTSDPGDDNLIVDGDATVTGQTNLGTAHGTTLLIDHIGEHTLNHSVVVDNILFVGGGAQYFTDPDTDHGMTVQAPTNAFGKIQYGSTGGATGGLSITGLTDDDATNPLGLVGMFGSTNPVDTEPAVAIMGAKKNGTSVQAVADGEMVFAAMNLLTKVFKIYGDGSVVVTGGAAIGNAATDLIGFYGATPVDQPATVVDANGTLADATTKINQIIDRLQELGLIA